MSEKLPNNSDCIQKFQPWQIVQKEIDTNYVPCTVEGCHRCFVLSQKENIMYQTGACIKSVEPHANSNFNNGRPTHNIKPKGKYL